MDNKPVKDWIIKVHQQVNDEMEVNRKMASDLRDMFIALENIIETLTQGDPRWNKIACIKDAKMVLRKIRGY